MKTGTYKHSLIKVQELVTMRSHQMRLAVIRAENHWTDKLKEKDEKYKREQDIYNKWWEVLAYV